MEIQYSTDSKINNALLKCNEMKRNGLLAPAQTSEKRQVERQLDNARLEVESQQNSIAHLKQELAERREHERLNQHSIALLDAKLGEKYVSKLNKKQKTHTIQSLCQTFIHLPFVINVYMPMLVRAG